jgi:hypothetical protein
MCGAAWASSSAGNRLLLLLTRLRVGWKQAAASGSAPLLHAQVNRL